MQRKQKQKSYSQMDAYRSIRKPIPKPSRVIHPKKKYDRRDKSWMYSDGDDDGEV